MLEAILPHETTHVVLAGMFGNHDVPRWVDELFAGLDDHPTTRELVAAVLSHLPSNLDLEPPRIHTDDPVDRATPGRQSGDGDRAGIESGGESHIIVGGALAVGGVKADPSQLRHQKFGPGMGGGGGLARTPPVLMSLRLLSR